LMYFFIFLFSGSKETAFIYAVTSAGKFSLIYIYPRHL
jgi:hypothetical protein